MDRRLRVDARLVLISWMSWIAGFGLNHGLAFGIKPLTMICGVATLWIVLGGIVAVTDHD